MSVARRINASGFCHRTRWRGSVWGARGATLLATLFSIPAHATQWHVGVLPGLGLEANGSTRFGFSGALSGDVLFGQKRTGQWGFGPAVEIGTFAFDDLRLSSTLAVQLPTDPIQLGLSLGPQLQSVTDALNPAVAARAFLGYRSYNHTGSYATAFGLGAGLDQRLDGNNGSVWSVSLHLDGMWLSLPFVALASWLRGSPGR